MLNLTEAKAQLLVSGTADDGLLAELCAAAGAFARAYCGREFDVGTYSEAHPGGGRYLFLAHYPASAAIVAGLDAAAYRVHGERGVVEAVGGRFPPGELAVAVTVPAGGVPAAVTRACAELVGHWYRQAKTYAATGQLNVGTVTNADGSSTAYPWGQSTGYRVPPGVVELLRLHRVPAA